MRCQVVLLLLLAMVLTGADRPPWRARKRPDIQPNRMASLRVSPGDWSAEPPSPTVVEQARFARALNDLCGWMPRARPGNYTKWILAAAAEFGEDPFLLGALIHRESRCQPRAEAFGGAGLTLIAPRMYQGDFKDGAYHFRVREAGHWVDRRREFPRFALRAGRLLNAESNIYLAAGLMSVWREQHDTVDGEFKQVPHRHYISHWVWGDRVKSARAEDRIFVDRRRLLTYYGSLRPPAAIRARGLELGSPLDGAPRVVSSALGSARDGGRQHRGVDVESDLGEPVRAIADGRVAFCGVDLPGQRHNQALKPEETNEYDRAALGRGGRYICLRHDRGEESPLRSCYMHLETVEVKGGAAVKRGDRIGTVGRTGMKTSSPHLHIETHLPDEKLDPAQLLRGHLIGEPVEFKPPRRRPSSGVGQ